MGSGLTTAARRAPARTAAPSKAGREGTGRSARTRARILAVALESFNARGAPNVTTNEIADGADISPGNLHYHFKRKQDVVLELHADYERRQAVVMAEIEQGMLDLDEVWLFVHLSFEAMRDYRFLFRDILTLLAAYPPLRTRMTRQSARARRSVAGFCHDMRARGAIAATVSEIEALATNVVLVSTFWLTYRSAWMEAGEGEDDGLAQGIFQVMSLFTPHLSGETGEAFRTVAARYLPADETH